MSKPQSELDSKLLQSPSNNTPLAPTAPPQESEWQEFEYRQRGEEPQLQLSLLVLLLLAPVLVVAHFWIADLAGIPILQYAFVTCLTAFLVNYMGIIRRYMLFPYLTNDSLDNRLKAQCVVAFAAVVLSIYYGWNGSGGLIFAIFWEFTRGQRMGITWLYFASIILGSLLMEENYTQTKLLQFLPGLMLGWVNSEIFKLSKSNEYTLVHQFLFCCSIAFPIFFPASTLIVPNLWQWALMIIAGPLMLLTLIVLTKAMQKVRVSVFTGVMAGLLMAGTSPYASPRQYVGVALIGVGVVFLMKTEFKDTT